MIDISDKQPSRREARAAVCLRCCATVVEQLRGGGLEKGDALAAARLAGISAAKNTHALIPLCHPLPVDFADVEFELREDGVHIRTLVKCRAATGVEMEALTAAAVAALTLYDMCKPLGPDMVITDLRLLQKSGGRHDYRREDDA